MKKTTLALLAFLSVIVLFAQTPQSFKYQAVARNIAGDILADQNVSFRISILESSAVGTAVYVESHSALTNQFGLVNLEIGSGVVITGTFISIEWGSNSYFLQIEMDENNGSNYQLMGSSQMLSVPYALYSENTANPDDSDWTISGDDLYSGVSGNVGIGTTTPEAQLDVAGHIAITGTGGSVFIGNGAGLNDDLTNNGNVYVGNVCGQFSTTASGNTALGGASLLHNSTGHYNVSIGSNANRYREEGNNNTVIGTGANYNGIGGWNNTIIGYEAGYNTYSGGANVFLGYQAGYNETSSNKLYIGNSSTSTPLIYGEFDNKILAVNGTLGVGTSSPNANLEVYNSDGQTDIRITKSAMEYSSAINFYTGLTHEWNILNPSGNNNLMIYRGTGNTTGNLILVSDGGRVGIGTNIPQARFQIFDGTDASLSEGGYLITGSTVAHNIVIDENEIMARNNGATNTLHLQREGGSLALHYDQPELDQVYINSSGWTGIGENSPNSKLHVNSYTGENGFRVQINGFTKLLVHSNGAVVAAHNVTTPTFAFQLQNTSIDLQGRGRAYSWEVYSDSRLKSNQRTIEYGLKELMQLQPKNYDHHSSSNSEDGDFVMVTNHKIATVGFIAQEVQQIIPEAVNEPDNETEDLWSMDYSKLIPVLTRAIQEQQEIIEDMKLEIEALKNQAE